MAAPAKKTPAKRRESARGPTRRRAREALGGSMSNDPKVNAGERDRDAIPHTGREGFGDGQELSHAKRRRR